MKRRVFRRRIPKDFKVILDLKLIFTIEGYTYSL